MRRQPTTLAGLSGLLAIYLIAPFGAGLAQLGIADWGSADLLGLASACAASLADAGLVLIGVVHTPWRSRLQTPRMGRDDGPVCRIEVHEPWVPALDGVERFERLEVLYWLHQFRRDLVRQSPADDATTYGTFALRTPARPNPIGTSIAILVARAPI